MSTHLTQFSAQELLEIRFGLQSPNAALRTKALAKVAASIPKELVDGNVFVEALQNGSVAGSAVDDALQFVRVLIGQRDAHADVELAGHFFNVLGALYNPDGEDKENESGGEERLKTRIKELEAQLREEENCPMVTGQIAVEGVEGEMQVAEEESEYDDGLETELDDLYDDSDVTLSDDDMEVVPGGIEIRPTREEVAKKTFKLSYNVVENKYYRDGTWASDRLASQAYSVKRVLRKQRRTGAGFMRDGTHRTGKLEWRVNLKGLEVAEIEIALNDTFRPSHGRISTIVTCGASRVRVPAATGSAVMKSVGKADYLDIRVKLMGNTVLSDSLRGVMDVIVRFK